MRVLAIGAHPDDVEWGMGGALLLLKERGWDIHILDLTRGEAAIQGTPEERSKEALVAAAMLGARRTILDMGDQKLKDDKKNTSAVKKQIESIHPDIVFAPHPDDKHPDHAAAGKIGKTLRAVLYRLHSEAAPTHVTDIAKVVDKKKQLVWTHKSQVKPHWEENFWKKVKSGEGFVAPPGAKLPDIFRPASRTAT